MKAAIYNSVVVALFLIMMGVVMSVMSPGMADTDLGVVDTQMHYPVIAAEMLVYAFLFTRIYLRPMKTARAIAALWAVAPILLMCLGSTLWSDDPSLTFRRAIMLGLSTLVAIVIGAEFDLPQIGRLFGAATLVHIALCAVFFVVARHYLYSPSDPGALKGLTTHKNVFGLEMGLAVPVFLYLPFRRLPMLRWPFAAIAFVLLVLSRSSGSLGTTLACLALFPFLFMVRFRGVQRIPLMLVSGLVATVLAGLLYLNADLIPGLFSKDSTLSGRTDLWSFVWVAIQRHPLLGYGFGSFWQGLKGDSLEIIRGVGWLVPTAHNGYLDLLLAVGGLGAAMFLPLLLLGVAKALRYLSVEQSSARYFPATFLAFWLIYNFNESALLTQTGIPYMMFIMITTSLAVRLPRRARAARSEWARDAAGFPDVYPDAFSGLGPLAEENPS